MLTTINHTFTAIGVSETWFNSSTNIEMFNIDGYNLIQVNRVNKKGGSLEYILTSMIMLFDRIFQITLQNMNHLLNLSVKIRNLLFLDVFIEPLIQI